MKYIELAQKAQSNYKHPIILAKVDSQIHELSDTVVNSDKKVEFLTTENNIGMRVYQRSLIFLFLRAVKEFAPNARVNVRFPLGDAVYIKCDNLDIQHNIEEIDLLMRKIAERDIVIKKEIMPLNDAMKYFSEHGMVEKEKLFSFRRVSSISMYDLDGFKNYFYGDLVYSTGVLTKFKLAPFKNGILLCYPNISNPDIVADVKNHDKLYNKLSQTASWAKRLESKTIGDLNCAIVNGQMNRIILMQEAKAECDIANIAADIIEKKKKFVLIAGPSSSGKTSFSNRLAVQLQTQGISCHTIAQDDYFHNRNDVPCDENGERNLESIDIVDLAQFDSDMLRLMNGERIEIPKFNFVTGEREYRGKHFVKMKENEIVIIEGIHCLNPRFLPSVDPYRIYISALTPLNIDEHNRISSSDLRMLRRMARDIKHRGTNPQETIKSWHKVRAGEEENIFPYQENADVIFNSSLVYEVPMMKIIVEPMLFTVPKDSDEWIEAKRMLKFLDFFLAYPSDLVPKNSILQEFLGDSCFDVG
jgi:uridine kinase